MRLQNFLKKSHQDTTATLMTFASKTHPIGLFFLPNLELLLDFEEMACQAQKGP